MSMNIPSTTTIRKTIKTSSRLDRLFAKITDSTVHSELERGYCNKLIFFFAAVASLKAAYQLLVLAALFFQGMHSPNARFFWILGRAMLNGLTLYEDIYEAKPPGAFVLSALSQWLFGNNILGFLLNGFILIAVPALLTLFVLKRCHRSPKMHWGFLAFIFGSLLVFYMTQMARPWQTEYFGAFFGILFVLILALPVVPRWTFAAITLSLFCSIGFKEPFIFTALAVAILLLPSRSAFLRRFVTPVALVAILGCLALAALGALRSYFEVHVQSMVGYRVFHYDPLWLRGFDFPRVLRNLFETSPLLPICILALIVFIFALRKQETLRLAVSLYFCLIAVGIGSDYQLHHFVFAVPFYAALFVRFFELARHTDAKVYVRSLLLVSALALLFTPLRLPETSYASSVATIRETRTNAKAIAADVDRILDACDVSRYFYIGGYSFFAYTEHSPLNFFPFTTFEQITRYHTPIKTRSINNLKKAKIIILHDTGYRPRTSIPTERALANSLKQILKRDFSDRPWSCAQGLPSPEGFTVLYKI